MYTGPKKKDIQSILEKLQEKIAKFLIIEENLKNGNFQESLTELNKYLQTEPYIDKELISNIISLITNDKINDAISAIDEILKDLKNKENKHRALLDSM